MDTTENSSGYLLWMDDPLAPDGQSFTMIGWSWPPPLILSPAELADLYNAGNGRPYPEDVLIVVLDDPEPPPADLLRPIPLAEMIEDYNDSLGVTFPFDPPDEPHVIGPG